MHVPRRFDDSRLFVESMNKRGVQPLLSILDEIGGWPIITGRNEWNESRQKWQNIDDYYAHLRGFHLLHDVRVATYGANAKEKTAVVSVVASILQRCNNFAKFVLTIILSAGRSQHATVLVDVVGIFQFS